MFAVIKSGGKQYKLKEGDKVRLEKLNKKKGDKIIFGDILLVADDNKVEIGQPFLKKAKIEGKVVKEGRGKKIQVIKYKSKTRYRRKIGHRQPYTEVQISAITF